MTTARGRIMPNETISSSFPASQQDVNNLKQTATDAAKDLSTTASGHVAKAGRQLKDLAGHAQEETAQNLDQVKVSLANVLESARDYAAERPFACIGAALALGLFIGFTRRRSND